VKIYGAILSPFVRKVLAVCKLKELDYEHVVIFPGDKSPEFLAVSPLGKIPGLEDGDLKISDSSVICEYLEEKYPQYPVLPATPERRALSRWYEEYADSKLAPNIAVFFFERALKPMMKMGEPDEDRLARLVAEEHPAIFAYLESQLPADGFIFGEKLSLADIALMSPFVNAGHVGYHVDPEQYPGLAAWQERVRKHPVMAELLAAEADMFKAMAS
jgi:glutathione S-transferase